MHGARLVGFALGAVLLGVNPPAFAGPQVTIYIGGYGQPAAPAPPQPAGPGPGTGVVPGEIAWGQAAAYARYVQYLQLLNYQSTHPTTPGEAAQYFTNGASVTTVPSAGPGSAYFTNGSEVTVPVPMASAAPPPPPPPPQSARPSPWWWGDSTPAAAPPPPPPAPAAAPLPAPASPATTAPVAVAAMSFDEWLQSMGAETPDTSPSEEASVVAVDALEEAPVSEPLAAAFEVRPRGALALRQKRERPLLHAPSRGMGEPVVWAFAAGLLLGALAMLRPRLRMRSP